jgi:hypothetical protein
MPRAERRALRAGQDGQNPVQPPRWNPRRRVPGHCPPYPPFESVHPLRSACPSPRVCDPLPDLLIRQGPVSVPYSLCTDHDTSINHADHDVHPLLWIQLTRGQRCNSRTQFSTNIKVPFNKKGYLLHSPAKCPSYIQLLDETTNVPIFVKADNAEEEKERHLRNQ